MPGRTVRIVYPFSGRVVPLPPKLLTSARPRSPARSCLRSSTAAEAGPPPDLRSLASASLSCCLRASTSCAECACKCEHDLGLNPCLSLHQLLPKGIHILCMSVWTHFRMDSMQLVEHLIRLCAVRHERGAEWQADRLCHAMPDRRHPASELTTHPCARGAEGRAQVCKSKDTHSRMAGQY